MHFALHQKFFYNSYRKIAFCKFLCCAVFTWQLGTLHFMDYLTISPSVKSIQNFECQLCNIIFYVSDEGIENACIEQLSEQFNVSFIHYLSVHYVCVQQLIIHVNTIHILVTVKHTHRLLSFFPPFYDIDFCLVVT